MSGQFIDAPAPKFIDAPAPTSTPAPAAGGLDIGGIAKKIGDAADGVYRNIGAARTAAARDPVKALDTVLGSQARAIAPYVKPVRDFLNSHNIDPTTGKVVPLSPVGKFAEDTVFDPLSYEGGAIGRGIGAVAKPVAGAIAGAVKPIGNYATDLREVLNDPKIAQAAGKIAHGLGKINPIPGMVNSGKDVLFLNPLPHALGNMTALNFMKNGLGTTAKGLRYGVTGAPKATVKELNSIGAGAWTPTLMDEPSPWGPVGWMNALGKKGVPVAVRGGAGAAAGGGIADKTAPSTATPQQRLSRDAEGAILGALTGASPEVLRGSNALMSRLETGHRAAMLEGLPRPLGAARDVAPPARPLNAPPANVDPKTGEYTPMINLNPHAISPNARARFAPQASMGHSSIPASRAQAAIAMGKLKAAAAEAAKAKAGAKPTPDTRAEAINATFGGGDKSPVAKIATAVGGPFASWQADVVPRNFGSALYNAPARVEAFARGQDEANSGPLKGKPYKVNVGGPVGAGAELAFNFPKYASQLLGPIGNSDPNQVTSPKSFSAKDALAGLAYDRTPGRDVVGPFFGDTKYPDKAPAIPSAALSAGLGWHFSNKTPATDAILQIMRATGLDKDAAARLYERSKR